MKAEIKIPKGWRRLRPGADIKTGSDRWFNYFDWIWSKCGIAGKVGMDFDKKTVFIRRIKSAKPSKSKEAPPCLAIRAPGRP